MESHEKAMDEIKSTDADAWIEPPPFQQERLGNNYISHRPSVKISAPLLHDLLMLIEVGSKVTKFKVRDKAGVGCLVGSCGSCTQCKDDLENYCPKLILTYNDVYHDGTRTDGGYSTVMVPNGVLGLGVVGRGGLGLVAVRFGKAFGMKVAVISTSPNKEKEAIEHLGADAFVVSRDEKQMQAAKGTMDGIIYRVSAVHQLVPLIKSARDQREDGRSVRQYPITAQIKIVNQSASLDVTAASLDVTAATAGPDES
ncbi:hypothetical protein ACLOJK_003153 [Asimina triloba]